VALAREVGYEGIALRPHVRVLSADYLASRLLSMGRGMARAAGAVVRGVGAGERLVPICLGDLVALYARKPMGGGAADGD